MVKAYDFVLNNLTEQGFHTTGAGWLWDKKKQATFWFVTKEKTLPPTVKKQGPPAKIEKHAAAFRKKHKKVKVARGRLVATVKRKFRTPESALRDLIKSEYVKARVADARVV